MSQSQRGTETLKTLKEQSAFIGGLQHKKAESKTAEMEKILSNSIQKAREKVQNVCLTMQSKALINDKLRQGQNINTINTESNRNKSIESGINSSAVASALKCLQTKVSTLQNQVKQNSSTISHLQKQNTHLSQNNNSLQSQNQRLCLQTTQLKHEIQILTKKLQEVQIQYSSKKSTESKKNESMIEKQKLLQSKFDKKQKQLQNRQKQFNKKIEQISLLQKDISNRQKILNTKQKTLVNKQEGQQELYRMHEKYKQTLQQNKRLTKQVEMGKTEIFKLETEIEILKQGRNVQPQQDYFEKIQKLEDEVKRAKDKNKFEIKVDALKGQNRRVVQELNSQYQKYARLDARFKESEKQAKLYRKKYTDTKQLLTELCSKVKKLPTNVSHQFKFLLVKISKADKEGGPRSDRSYSRISYSDSKSQRMKSNSKSIKSGKKKILKIQDLDKSRQSSRSISSKKSRVIYHKNNIQSSTLISPSKPSTRKRSTSVNKTQHSNISIDMSDKQLLLCSQKNQLQKIILQMKKQFKALSNKLDNYQTNDEKQKQQIRQRLNDLNDNLQLKMEEMNGLKIRLRKI